MVAVLPSVGWIGSFCCLLLGVKHRHFSSHTSKHRHFSSRTSKHRHFSSRTSKHREFNNSQASNTEASDIRPAMTNMLLDSAAAVPAGCCVIFDW